MKCPICGTTVPAGVERCPDCGYRCLSASTPAANPTDHYTFPQPERRSCLSRFGCCLGVFAALFLIFGLLALSITAFIQYEDSVFVQREPEYPTQSIPTEIIDAPEADGDCFSIRDGAVQFHSEAWDGGRVLRIPDTVAGEAVTALAPGCFRDCGELTTILLPDSVTKIDRSAFDGCTNLRGLYIPEGCTTIDADAFDGCISLEAVYIPGSMESIASGAFDDCAALRLIFYAGDYETWNGIYNDYITPFTAAVCLDGSYYHAAP